MKYAKLIFVVLLIGSLTSFVEKDKPTGGLNVGDVAPSYLPDAASLMLSDQPVAPRKGGYVLLSFGAGYPAHSRMLNTTLSNVLRDDSLNQKVEMVSVSFDEYPSVARETVRMDRIVAPLCFAETKGTESELYKRYRLHRGFANYLLDDRGVIIAKNVTARELASYLN